MLFSSNFHLKIVRHIIITPHFTTQLLNNHTYNKIPQLAPTPISSSRVFCLDVKVKMVLSGKSITTKVTPEVLYIEMLHPPVGFEVVSTTGPGTAETLATHGTA